VQDDALSEDVELTEGDSSEANVEGVSPPFRDPWVHELIEELATHNPGPRDYDTPMRRLFVDSLIHPAQKILTGRAMERFPSASLNLPAILTIQSKACGLSPHRGCQDAMAHLEEA
jgi:hypothetical protein